MLAHLFDNWGHRDIIAGSVLLGLVSILFLLLIVIPSVKRKEMVRLSILLGTGTVLICTLMIYLFWDTEIQTRVDNEAEVEAVFTGEIFGEIEGLKVYSYYASFQAGVCQVKVTFGDGDTMRISFLERDDSKNLALMQPYFVEPDEAVSFMQANCAPK